MNRCKQKTLTLVLRLQDKYDVQSGANGDIFALVLDGHGIKRILHAIGNFWL